MNEAVPVALSRWTNVLDHEFGVAHHWDLPYGQSVYRVFLLPNSLEVDIAFTPLAEFRPLGPAWQLVFGDAGELEPETRPQLNDLVGHAMELLEALWDIPAQRLADELGLVGQERAALFALRPAERRQVADFAAFLAARR